MPNEFTGGMGRPMSGAGGPDPLVAPLNQDPLAHVQKALKKFKWTLEIFWGVPFRGGHLTLLGCGTTPSPNLENTQEGHCDAMWVLAAINRRAGDKWGRVLER